MLFTKTGFKARKTSKWPDERYSHIETYQISQRFVWWFSRDIIFRNRMTVYPILNFSVQIFLSVDIQYLMIYWLFEIRVLWTGLSPMDPIGPQWDSFLLYGIIGAVVFEILCFQTLGWIINVTYFTHCVNN